MTSAGYCIVSLIYPACVEGKLAPVTRAGLDREVCTVHERLKETGWRFFGPLGKNDTRVIIFIGRQKIEPRIARLQPVKIEVNDVQAFCFIIVAQVECRRSRAGYPPGTQYFADEGGLTRTEIAADQNQERRFEVPRQLPRLCLKGFKIIGGQLHCFCIRRLRHTAKNNNPLQGCWPIAYYTCMVKIGQRQTQQRGIIHDIIMESDRPLTIANLVTMAQERKAKIGQATVYRTVNALLDAGEIQAVSMPGGEALYEKAHLHHHHHFKCQNCGKVYDLPGCPDGVDLQEFLPKNFTLTTHEFTFYGTCANCG